MVSKTANRPYNTKEEHQETSSVNNSFSLGSIATSELQHRLFLFRPLYLIYQKNMKKRSKLLGPIDSEEEVRVCGYHFCRKNYNESSRCQPIAYKPPKDPCLSWLFSGKPTTSLDTSGITFDQACMPISRPGESSQSYHLSLPIYDSYLADLMIEIHLRPHDDHEWNFIVAF